MILMCGDHVFAYGELLNYLFLHYMSQGLMNSYRNYNWARRITGMVMLNHMGVFITLNSSSICRALQLTLKVLVVTIDAQWEGMGM